MRFHIVSPTFNAEAFVGEAIASVQEQTHTDFRCTIVDDVSTDRTVDRALEAMGGDDRFQIVRNESKHFALGSCWRGIEASAPRPEEVVVVLDGDDRLSHHNVLTVLSSLYSAPECWMTYGSFADMDGKRDKESRPYRPSTRRHQLYRRRGCGVPHLRTFRYQLWRQIPWTYFTLDRQDIERARRRALLRGRWRHWWHWRRIVETDLLDASGRFPRRLCDKVPGYAMLEMAGPHALFVPDILLLYRKYEKNYGFFPHGRFSKPKWYWRLIREIVENREPLARIADLGVAEDTSSRSSERRPTGLVTDSA